jgi:2,4-dienoyl-CoA reductase-like NADH-dependent reductase (Old Yellow Enzyme family)
MAVGVRIGCEGGPGSYTFEETKILAKELEELGIDYLSVTHGFPYSVDIWREDGAMLRARGYAQIIEAILDAAKKMAKNDW